MADPRRRLPGNAPGALFVDDTCIDCDTCRQLASAVFREHAGQSVVGRQPVAEEVEAAALAAVACPTASIGGVPKHAMAAAAEAFPTLVTGAVRFCGYTSADSYGAWSWLVVRPPERGGNVLLDSPRYAEPLARRIEQLGGVRTLFLTHRDDVADHARWARRFGCERVMHAGDARGLGVERVITGRDPVALDDELLAIPTPGHTRGHAVLLYRPDRALFTGDHLAGEGDALTAYRSVCWHSWTEQTRSMERLLDHEFAWVLPGHGPVHHAEPALMRERLAACVAWMRRVG